MQHKLLVYKPGLSDMRGVLYSVLFWKLVSLTAIQKNICLVQSVRSWGASRYSKALKPSLFLAVPWFPAEVEACTLTLWQDKPSAVEYAEETCKWHSNMNWFWYFAVSLSFSGSAGVGLFYPLRVWWVFKLHCTWQAGGKQCVNKNLCLVCSPFGKLHNFSGINICKTQCFMIVGMKKHYTLITLLLIYPNFPLDKIPMIISLYWSKMHVCTVNMVMCRSLHPHGFSINKWKMYVYFFTISLQTRIEFYNNSLKHKAN